MSLSKTDLLSVIITNYNKPIKQIEECVESILDQTVLPKEIILVDDCSKDRPTHVGCISIVLPENVGVARARSIGVKMSTGKLILFVDSDDKLSPDFIQQCGKVITKCDIAYPDLIAFEEGKQSSLIENPNKIKPKHLLGHKLSIPVTSMMRRTVYDKLEGFRDLPVYEDWDFWIRSMANGFRFKKAHTILHYRQSSNSRLHTKTQQEKLSIHEKIVAPYTIKDNKICEI